jgi:hypothetical protein
VCTRINRKVFQRVSKPHTVVHVKISLQSPQGTADHLVLGHLVTWSLTHLQNFPFKIVASMILFIIFFTGHLVTGSLGHWPLGHLVTWSLSHLVTSSLGDKPFWACTLQLCKISLQSPQGTADHLVTGHLVTWSLTHLDYFTFKIVVLMILFIIFFKEHLVTGHLVTWSLGHLVT